MILGKIVRVLRHIRATQRLNLGLSRAAATRGPRAIDCTNPLSWEFVGLSQHGEDGIIDFLTRQLKREDRYFVEVGCADGTENNSAFLAIGRKYAGLMVDADASALAWCQYLIRPMNYGVNFLQLSVSRDNVREILDRTLEINPDVFSLDIDGVDYHVMNALLKEGFRPKIAVVEYNSVFGPDNRLTVSYREDFKVARGRPHHLYYGCSISGWIGLFEAHHYRFVTVESSGTNAFFIDPSEFDADFVDGIRGASFGENSSQLREYGKTWAEQFELIKNMDFEQLP